MAGGEAARRCGSAEELGTEKGDSTKTRTGRIQKRMGVFLGSGTDSTAMSPSHSGLFHHSVFMSSIQNTTKDPSVVGEISRELG